MPHSLLYHFSSHLPSLEHYFNMENDIIAHIYPHNDNKWASKAIEANRCHRRPRLERPRTQFNRGERESTQPLETWNVSAFDYLPYLEITFSDIPRTNRGLLFGYNPYCDVVLPNQGISGTHFSLTFDQSNRLIVKDLNSLRGTEVTYDGRGKGARRGFQWIIGGHDILQDKRRVAIAVPDIISFQIFVPIQSITSAAYIDKVNRFKQGTATTEDLIDNLGLSRPLTRPPTGAHTPDTGEIYLRKKLGKGAFSTVTHLWNVSTGDERVVKAPNHDKRVFNKQAWYDEARIMGQLSHVRVPFQCE